MNRNISYAILFSLFAGCSVYYKLKYKTSNPKDERHNQQIAFFEKHGIDTSNMFNLRGESADIFWTTQYPIYTFDTINPRPIQVRAFDSTGLPIFNWSICYGFIQNFMIDGELKHAKFTESDTTLKFHMISELVDRPKDFSKILNPKNRRYIVSIWATYFGTPMAETLLRIDSLCKNSPINTVHIKCNLGKWVD